MTSLDDLEYMRKLDKSDMLQFLRRFPEDCRRAIEITKEADLSALANRAFSSVVFVGMGGSAIGGQLISDWLRDKTSVPMHVSKGYSIPGFIGSDTLVVTVSYSGNTEETLCAFEKARERDAAIICVTSGGRLLELSHERGLPYIQLPSGMKPRAAIPFQLFTLVTSLRILGLIQDSWEEIEEAIGVVESLREELFEEVTADSNPAKRLALELRNKIPFIYSSGFFEGVVYRFGTQMNENGKVPASSGVFPEILHNAALGFEGPDEVLKPLGILIIRDREETAQETRKIEGFKDMFKERVGKMIEMESRGEGRLARMLSVLYVGDYVSVYTGILNGKDPSSMDAIDTLKSL
jgi:glucose/mannose-6-phosphate isomerase